MNTPTFTKALCITLLFFSTCAYAAQQTHYKNQNGSQMDLVFKKETNTNGTLSGTFTTAVAAPDCQQVIGKKRPISGYYVGNAVSISVSFPQCHSIVSFSGNVNKDGDLALIWLITSQAKKANSKTYTAKTIGYDQFNKQGA